jgi:hypothetical protein
MRLGETGLRRVVLTVAAVAAIAIALGSWQGAGGADGAANASTPAAFDVPAQGLVLRLHDLPPGYVQTQGSVEFPLPGRGCAPIEPADPGPPLAAFLRRYSPVGCLALYLRLFRTPDRGPTPLAVGTAAIETGSVAGAVSGLATSRELISHLLGDRLPIEALAPETVGDGTRRYRWKPESPFSEEGPSTFIVWRSGSVVAATFVRGGSIAANDRAALHFARLQQARIEVRTPYTLQEADDTEVPLEDPALQVPVHWLGPTFAAGRGLPRLHLAETYSTADPSPARASAGLLYTDHLSFHRAEMISLYAWMPRDWKAYRARKGLPFELRCPQPHALDLPDGRAVVYAGQRPGRRCGEPGPTSYAATVHFPGVVITVERGDTCEDCARTFDAPYDSFRGMASIARGLEPRIRRLEP